MPARHHGERRNPITASLVTGRRASDATLGLGWSGALGDDVYQAVLGEFVQREINQVERASQAYDRRAMEKLRGPEGPRRGRPTRETVQARRLLGGRYRFASLLDREERP